MQPLVNIIACPQCRTDLQLPARLAPGVVFACPRCRAAIRVPGAAPALTPAVAPAPSSPPPSVPAPSVPAPKPAIGTALPFASPVAASSAPVPQAPVNSLGTPADQADAVKGTRRRRQLLIVAGLVLVFLLGMAFFFLGNRPSPAPDGGTWVDDSHGPSVPEPSYKPASKKPGAGAKQLIQLSAQEADQVDAMVRKGVAYLKTAQAPEGYWGSPGMEAAYTAFVGLTLISSGVPVDDPAVAKAVSYARKKAPYAEQVYAASLLLLFLDKLENAGDRDLIQALAMRLAAGQTAQGGWSYSVPALALSETQRLAKQLAVLDKGGKVAVKDLGLPASWKTPGVFQPPHEDPEFFRHVDGGDNSNTQFALLALWAARRHQLPVNECLKLVARRFRMIQNADGSFNYRDRQNISSFPTMTCAGLLGLAVGYGIEEAKGNPLQDDNIVRALALVSRFIGDPSASSKDALVDMYFLWSVERVGMLYSLDKIDGKDWYRWGMSLLKATQSAQGHWHGRGGHVSDSVADTCFALLFLRRVNLAVDLTDKLTEFGGPQLLGPPAGKK